MRKTQTQECSWSKEWIELRNTESSQFGTSLFSECLPHSFICVPSGLFCFNLPPIHRYGSVTIFLDYMAAPFFWHLTNWPHNCDSETTLLEIRGLTRQSKPPLTHMHKWSYSSQQCMWKQKTKMFLETSYLILVNFWLHVEIKHTLVVWVRTVAPITVVIIDQ